MNTSIKPYAKGYGKFMILAPLLIIIEVIGELSLPSIIGSILDDGIANQNLELIAKLGGIMTLICIGCMICGIFAAKFASIAGQGFGANLRDGLFGRIQEFSFGDIDRFSSASLITRMTNDVNNLQTSLTMGLRIMTRAPVQLVVALFMAISISPKLAIVLGVVIPIMALAIMIVLRTCIPLFRKLQERIDNLNSTVQENLVGIRVVKAFVRVDHEKMKFSKANDDLTGTALNVSMRMIFMQPIMMMCLYIAIAGVLWNGGQLYMVGELSVGELSAFITYIMQILISFIMFAMCLFQVTRAQASLKRVKEVLGTQSEIQDGPATKLPEAMGAVTFKNVAFKYRTEGAGDDVLTNIDLEIPAGKMVAIVGGTGTGKSSLVNLIPRFYDVTGGQVLVDGMDVREYPLEDLRSRIGMVLQKNVLFSGTIRDNLKWGNPDADDETLIKVAKDAQAYEFISAQDKGLDAMLEQGGVNLSGGQKQRMCIARAMLKNPKILIMDDSTSAVDTATEGNIRAALRANWSDTTVILIAQRISSVQYADVVVVLDDGQIADIGTHDELMTSSNIYQEIYNSQQEGVSE